MSKKPLRIILISIVGFIIGLFNIFIFYNENSIVFFIMGFLCVILSFGLFNLWNWARMIAKIAAILFMIIYGYLIVYAFAGYNYHHGFAFIGLIFNLPLLLLCLWVLDCLNNPKIKALFKQ